MKCYIFTVLVHIYRVWFYMYAFCCFYNDLIDF